MADYAPVDLTAEGQVEFELNGRRVTAPAGTMLVDAAHAHGIEVPVFCYEPRLGPPVGACRMCLVEIEGMRGLQTACSTPVQPDMVVRTNSELAKDGQDGVLEFLLENHPLDCPVCDKGGECPLQDRTFTFGPGRTRFVETKRHFPKPLDLSSLIALDRERCISCWRCVRFSQDVAEDKLLTMQDRGARSEIATMTGDQYEGRFTGNIIDICPVGALTSIPYRFTARPWDVSNTPSICGGCPAGCNVELTTREGHVARVTGRPEPNYAVEEGWICDRGRFSYPGDRAPERITAPVIRDEGRTRESSLDDAVAAAGLVLRPRRPRRHPGGADRHGGGGLPRPGAGRRPRRTRWSSGSASPGQGLEALRSQPAAQLGDIDAAGAVLIVGGDPRQPAVGRRAAGAQGAPPRRAGDHGRLPPARPRGARHRRARPARPRWPRPSTRWSSPTASDLVVLWDEADLAAEPDAAGALARLVAARGARQIELGADVNGAGLRALGLPATGVLEAAAAGEIDTLLTIHADPLVGAGASDWGWALGRVRTRIAIAAFATAARRGGHGRAAGRHALRERGRLRGDERAGPAPAPRRRPARGRGPRLGDPDRARPPPRRAAALPHRRARLRRAPPPRGRPSPGWTTTRSGVLGAQIGAVAPISPNGANGPREIAGAGLPLVTTERIFGNALTYRSDALAAVRTGRRPGAQPGRGRPPRAGGRRPGAPALAPRRVPRSRCAPTRTTPRAPPSSPPACPAAGVERLLAADRGPVRVEIDRRPMNEAFLVILIKAIVVVFVLITGFAYTLLWERKLIGRFQARYGPNRAGPIGYMQPLADVVKLIFKEDFVPRGANRFLFQIAPMISVFAAVAAVAVIPFGDPVEILGYNVQLVGADLNIGVLFLFALSGLGFYGLILGGWASGNKYSLLGAARTAAQLVSYEVAMGLSVIGVIMMAQSLSLVDIVHAQQDIGLVHPPAAGRLPDLPDRGRRRDQPRPVRPARGRVGAGRRLPHRVRRPEVRHVLPGRVREHDHHLGARARRSSSGGFAGPVPARLPVADRSRSSSLLFLFIWLRATLPRLRYDRLMKLGWKILLPLATLNLVVTAIVVALGFSN